MHSFPSFSPTLIAIFLLAAVSPAPALTLSLPEIGPRVRSHHLSLKAARLAVAEARGRQLGAGRLTNPTVGTEFQNESQVSPGSIGVSIDQAFPLTRRLSLEKKLSAQLVEAAALEVRDAERKLVAEAESRAVKLIALDQQRVLRQQQVELTGKLADFIKGRAAAGELSALDATQMQVDAQRLQLEGRRLENEAISLAGELKPMLGLSSSDEIKLKGPLPAMKLPARAGWERRTDYQFARKKLEAATTETDLAQAKRWGDMSVGLFTAREWQKVGGERDGTGYFGLRMSLPWPLWNRNEGEIAEKKAGAERSRLETVALASQISSEAETARREMEAAASLAHDTSDKLLPLIIEHATKVEKAYAASQAELPAVQRSREQRLQTESAALDAVRDFHLARIRYEAAIGGHSAAR